MWIVLTKLLAHEASGKPSTLSKELDIILEEEGKAKAFSLYNERWFTKLGYTAGAVLDCVPEFNKVLDGTSSNNLLIQACRIYLSCDYIHSSFLANFTYNATMPFLNCVVKSDQSELLSILP